MDDYYKVLGIDKSADDKQIKLAYFKHVRLYPPERYPEEFKKIRSAYETLSNGEQRAKYDEYSDIDDEAAILLNQAQAEKELKRFDRANALYKQIIVAYPDLNYVKAEYADFLSIQGKNGNAILLWEELRKSDPDNVKYMERLANAYKERGWRKKAVDAYITILEKDDGNADCWNSLIGCYVSGNNNSEAKHACFTALDALKRNGKENIYIHTLAAVYRMKGYEGSLEGCLGDILRMMRGNLSDKTEQNTQIAGTLLSQIVMNEKYNYLPYIREMVNTLHGADDSLLDELYFCEIHAEIESLSESNFDDTILRYIKLSHVYEKINVGGMDIISVEFDILSDIDALRPQLLRLRKEHPRLFGLGEAFFNECIRTRNPEPLLRRRYKTLSRSGYFDDEEYDEDEDFENVQHTVYRDETKVGRNDPCPCGSGKKYKKCCGALAGA